MYMCVLGYISSGNRSALSELTCVINKSLRYMSGHNKSIYKLLMINISSHLKVGVASFFARVQRTLSQLRVHYCVSNLLYKPKSFSQCNWFCFMKKSKV